MQQTRSCARIAAVIIVALILVSVGGCGSMKPLPSDTFYRLKIGPPTPTNSITTSWTDDMVRVAKFRGSGVHRERAIAYTETDQVVVKQHRYHLWIDSPERMLQTELVSYLRAANVAPAISSSDMSSAGFEIQAQIRRMDHVLAADGAGVVVAFALELVERNAGKSFVFGKEYRESRSVSGNDMSAVAVAMSDAVGVIFERFTADAGAALQR